MALATAVIAAASPHLSRPLRYLGRWVVGAGALASVVVGIAHPVGVVGGFAIGIGAAAVTHLLLGSPGGRLSLEQMRRVLADLGVEVDDLSYAPLEPRGVSLARRHHSVGGIAPREGLRARCVGRAAPGVALGLPVDPGRGSARRRKAAAGGARGDRDAVRRTSGGRRAAHRDRGHGGGP